MTTSSRGAMRWAFTVVPVTVTCVSSTVGSRCSAALLPDLLHLFAEELGEQFVAGGDAARVVMAEVVAVRRRKRQQREVHALAVSLDRHEVGMRPHDHLAVGRSRAEPDVRRIDEVVAVVVPRHRDDAHAAREGFAEAFDHRLRRRPRRATLLRLEDVAGDGEDIDLMLFAILRDARDVALLVAEPRLRVRAGESVAEVPVGGEEDFHNSVSLRRTECRCAVLSGSSQMS